MIGSGVQARHQVACLRVVRPVARVVAWSPNPQRLAAYCEELRQDGIDAVAAASVEAVCREADLLVTTTPSRRPLVDAGWLRPASTSPRLDRIRQANRSSRPNASTARTSSSSIACVSARRSESSSMRSMRA